MEGVTKLFLYKIVLSCLLAETLHATTVNPARCPTNKIAPHRHIPSLGYNRARTFGGAFIDLLTPDLNFQNGAENDLQEKPQEEDDDCGEIEDYDETDIGSLTTQSQRRNGHEENRFFFGLFNNVGQRPPNTATTRVTQMPGTSYRPQNQHPQGSYPPTRPPYWSGGHFGNNVYRPPQAQDPSDNVKPVHEYSDIQMNYWPGIVGGLVSNIFPASPARPSVGSTTQRPPARPPYINFEQSTRRPRQRGINNDNNIIRSFFDLFF